MQAVEPSNACLLHVGKLSTAAHRLCAVPPRGGQHFLAAALPSGVEFRGQMRRGFS